mgnify:CR=1 FL=1
MIAISNLEKKDFISLLVPPINKFIANFKLSQNRFQAANFLRFIEILEYGEKAKRHRRKITFFDKSKLIVFK